MPIRAVDELSSGTSTLTIPSLDEQALFEVLSHPLRRKMLKLLAAHYILSYSDFKEILQQNPGVIYHHLEKIQSLNLVTQRDTKEYELTPLGWKVVENMEILLRERLDEAFSQGFIVRLFKGGFLPSYLQHSPRRAAIELALLITVFVILTQDFPILVVGPFLLPTSIPFGQRLLFSILSSVLITFIYIVLVFLFTNQEKRLRIFSDRKNFSFFVGLLLFPMSSYLVVSLLWFSSFFLITLPEPIFWILTIGLHVWYLYVSLNILTGVKNVSFEKSVIITLIQQYVLLLLVFLLFVANAT